MNVVSIGPPDVVRHSVISGQLKFSGSRIIYIIESRLVDT